MRVVVSWWGGIRWQQGEPRSGSSWSSLSPLSDVGTAKNRRSFLNTVSRKRMLKRRRLLKRGSMMSRGSRR